MNRVKMHDERITSERVFRFRINTVYISIKHTSNMAACNVSDVSDVTSHHVLTCRGFLSIKSKKCAVL